MINYRKGSGEFVKISEVTSGGRLAPGVYNAFVTNCEDGELTRDGNVVCTERVTFQVENEGEKYILSELFFLSSTSIWKGIAFLRAIGVVKEVDDEFCIDVFDKSNVVGKSCRVLVEDKTFTGKDGEKHTTSEIKKYYPILNNKESSKDDNIDPSGILGGVKPLSDEEIPF